PARRRVVPHRRARPGVGDLQRGPVFLHRPVLPDHGHRDARLRLAVGVRPDGRDRARLRPRLEPPRPGAGRPSARQCGGGRAHPRLRRGFTLSAARKVPIVAGLLLSTIIVGCNYVSAQWVVIAFMSLAFFGKGVGALGWAVMSDVAPRDATGITAGLFNMVGNLAG